MISRFLSALVAPIVNFNTLRMLKRQRWYREEKKNEMSHEEGGMGHGAMEEGTSAWRRRATLSACSRVSLTDMQRSLVAGTSGTIARDEKEKKTKTRREDEDDDGGAGEVGGGGGEERAVANLKGRPRGVRRSLITLMKLDGPAAIVSNETSSHAWFRSNHLLAFRVGAARPDATIIWPRDASG